MVLGMSALLKSYCDVTEGFPTASNDKSSMLWFGGYLPDVTEGFPTASNNTIMIVCYDSSRVQRY
jgi:hypothetical protein